MGLYIYIDRYIYIYVGCPSFGDRKKMIVYNPIFWLSQKHKSSLSPAWPLHYSMIQAFGAGKVFGLGLRGSKKVYKLSPKP